MKISVLVATYRRPKLLVECLTALSQQQRLPDEIVIIVRDTDEKTMEALSAFENPFPNPDCIQTTRVQEPGIVAAENRGLEAAKGDIVVLIDDDAIASPEWLSNIENHYESETVGAVGGPVIPFIDQTPVKQYQPGRFMNKTWFGAHFGGAAETIPDTVKEVNVLRGCNMSFRRSLLTQFDIRLMPYWRRFEDEAIMSIRQQGYQALFDPNIQVYHHTAAIQEGESREEDRSSIIGSHHNNTYVMLKFFSIPQQFAFLVFTFLIGDLHHHGFIGYLIKGCLQWRLWRRIKEMLHFKGKLPEFKLTCDG